MKNVYRQKPVLLLALLTLAAVLLAACGGNSNETQPAPAESAQPSAAPSAEPDNKDEEAATERKLVDPLGHEVTVPAEPQAVLASYLEDYLVALDVTPVAQWAISDSPMVYLQDDLAGVPTIPFDLPFEAVTSATPDIILIGDESLIADGKYDTYSKIAPTYALGQDINADWRLALKEIGKVLGKSGEADNVLAAYDEQLKQAQEQMDAVYESRPSATAIWLVSNSFWMVSDTQSSGDVLYRDLGLAVPELVAEVSKGEGGIWKSVSMEALAGLDADHIFLINSDVDAGSPALNDPVWQSIKAVKEGNVHEFPGKSAWLYTGPIANKKIVEDVLESLLP